MIDNFRYNFLKPSVCISVSLLLVFLVIFGSLTKYFRPVNHQINTVTGGYSITSKHTTSHFLLKNVKAFEDSNVISNKIKIARYGISNNSIWIKHKGTFVEGINFYNQFFHNLVKDLRSEILEDWEEIEIPARVLYANSDHTLEILQERYPSIITVYLAANLEPGRRHFSAGNSIVKKYYEWSASDILCSWINQKRGTRARYDIVFNGSCQTSLIKTFIAKPIEPVYFYGKQINKNEYWPKDGHYPYWYYTVYPRESFYNHIIKNALVTQTGEVFSKNLKYVPLGCLPNRNPYPPKRHQLTPLYQEVLTIAQAWGAAFFHLNVESMPRLAPLLTFLHHNPHVHIHVAQGSKGGYINTMMKLLGLENQLVEGVVRAQIVYLPQTTPCGFALPHHSQLLSFAYQKAIKSDNESSENIKLKSKKALVYQVKPTANILVDSANSTRNYITQSELIRKLNKKTSLQNDTKSSFFAPKKHRRNLIQIQRSGNRHFKNREQLTEILRDLAQEFQLNYILFRDDPVPKPLEAAKLFNNAALVVAPHGAGLSNILFAPAGVYVLEAVCNRPHVNLCFLWLAHVLGHHYHAVASREGCERFIDANLTEIKTISRIFLKSWSDSNS